MSLTKKVNGRSISEINQKIKSGDVQVLTAEEMKKFTSFKQSVEYFEKTIEDAIQTISNVSEDELLAPLPEGPVMGGAPKVAVVSALADHTAHHRGALSVYARLLGKVSSMPYGDM